jgi:hypothetical protein
MSLTFTDAFVAIECCSCHITFGITETTQKILRGEHSTFYCPNGHPNYYPGEKREEVLERQLQAANSEKERLNNRLELEKKKVAGQKAAASRYRNDRDRIMKRAKAGVCPCCNRTFQNLARHMKTKHVSG